MVQNLHNPFQLVSLQNPVLYDPQSAGAAIASCLNDIVHVHEEIAQQFPHIFDNIVKASLSTATVHVLQTNLALYRSVLQNLREFDTVETKIDYFRSIFDKHAGESQQFDNTDLEQLQVIIENIPDPTIEISANTEHDQLEPAV